MKKVRIFDFDGRVRMPEALRTVKAALDDEGLALHEGNTPDRPMLVWMPEWNRTRVVVPASRIVSK